MVVRMREVLPRRWVGVCVPLALNLSYRGMYMIGLVYRTFHLAFPQRSVYFIGIVHLTATTFSFTEQKYYPINTKIATEIGLKTLFHNIAYN